MSDARGYIDEVAALRSLYSPPGERAVRKQLAELDAHCRNFIALSPFVVIATSDGERLDASPRGGAAGFVTVPDAATLLIPDSPGNNRLDSLSNIVRNPAVGLLFMIPGVDETLRVNGRARLKRADATAEASENVRAPKILIEVTVEEAYLHCAKALMRSNLWSPEVRQDRSVLPTLGEMLRDQVGGSGPVESQAEMVARYRKDL